MNSLRRGASLAVLLAFAQRLHAIPPDPELYARVSVDVRQAPLANFLDALSAQAKVSFILLDGTEGRQVTAFLHDVTVKDALDVVKEADGIDYRRLGSSDTWFVGPKDSLALREPPVIEGGAVLDQRVTVKVKNAPLSEFLDTLSAQSKINFIMQDGLEGKKVTAFLQNVSVREALEIMLALKGLSCRRFDGKDTYIIVSKS
jgi:type II secretory pathway component HofQ